MSSAAGDAGPPQIDPLVGIIAGIRELQTRVAYLEGQVRELAGAIVNQEIDHRRAIDAIKRGQQ